MLGLGCQSVSLLASADKTLVPEWAALSLCMWQYDLAAGIRDRNGNGLSFLVIGNCCSEKRKKSSKVEAKVHSYYKCHLFKYQDHWKGILFISRFWKIKGICLRVSPQWSQYRKWGNKGQLLVVGFPVTLYIRKWSSLWFTICVVYCFHLILENQLFKN